MQLYFNGDSFVAGVELGDDVLSGYPGLRPWMQDGPLKTANEQWISSTYDQENPRYNERMEKFEAISQLEYQRAFPNLVAIETGCQVTNHGLGGSSMDRIVRTSLIGLNELKKKYPDEKIVAFIGTTFLGRSSIASYDTYGHDVLGFHKDWICIATNYNRHENNDVNQLLKYKILYEKQFHQVVDFYQNVMILNSFCEKNNIDVYYVSTFDASIPANNVEPEYKDRPIIEVLTNSVDFKYAINMTDYIDYTGNTNQICPSSHFGSPIHERTAKDIVKILERY